MKTKEIVKDMRLCASGECTECTMAVRSKCIEELLSAAAYKLEKYDVAINNQENEIDALKKHVAELKKELSEREAGQRWISVEDDLPKESGKLYWVYRKRGKISLSCYYSETNGWGFNDVAYWMPFPRFPKQKVKTYKDVFLEAFPKAFLPTCCRNHIFGNLKSCSFGYACEDCWNQPYPEEEGGAE